MLEIITALLVSDAGEPFEKLEMVLERQGIRTYWARDSAEALLLLERPNPPQMVFTDTTLPDGTWADVVSLAARHLVPVILVSRLMDRALYVHSLERGAFDFIVPPFVSSDVAHIVKCAAWSRNHWRRRQASAAARLFS